MVNVNDAFINPSYTSSLGFARDRLLKRGGSRAYIHEIKKLKNWGMNFMLSQEQVKHIAHLARIELSESEVEKYQKQLGRVLDYVNKLKEVETNGVATADGGTREMANVWQEDERQGTRDKGQVTGLIEMAPEVEGGQVKVGRVFRDKR